MLEEWEDIKDWPYEVSSLGRVRRLLGTSRQGIKILSPGKSVSGHRYVYLCKNGMYKYKSIHRLVADAFIRPLKNEEVVHHIDSNPTNNSMSNLEILKSRGDNALRAVLDGCRDYKIGKEEVSQIKKLLNIGNLTQQEIADKFGLAIITIHRIKTGKRWSHVKEAI